MHAHAGMDVAEQTAAVTAARGQIGDEEIMIGDDDRHRLVDVVAGVVGVQGRPCDDPGALLQTLDRFQRLLTQNDAADGSARHDVGVEIHQRSVMRRAVAIRRVAHAATRNAQRLGLRAALALPRVGVAVPCVAFEPLRIAATRCAALARMSM